MPSFRRPWRFLRSRPFAADAPPVFFYHGRVSATGARNLERAITLAIGDGAPRLILCLSSQGGDVGAGLGMYHFLRMQPVPVDTHAAGLCASIAVTAFVAGARRTAAPASRFTLHAPRFTSGPQKGALAPHADLIAAPFQDHLGWSAADTQSRFGPEDFHVDPPAAITLGLIHAIEDQRAARPGQLILIETG